jgi:putative ABC transport system substrate-binding protein
MIWIQRREFITLLGGAAATWPRAARAQQPTVPVIGFLNSQSHDAFIEPLRAFRQGLKETGYVEGENVAFEYRWADNQLDRLPVLAAELTRRQVSIIAGSTPAVALAAKQATTAVPIVFLVNEDPVKLGLVASPALPGGNATGINIFSAELTAKRLDLLRQLVPGMARVAVLVNPANATSTETTLKDVEAAARSAGLQINVLNASTSPEIEVAFASRERPEFAEAGGLMSYGANLADAFRQIGVYAGRILKGAKPADLPVVQSSKFELVINAPTARMLGLTVPPTLLAIADEVIE